MKKGRKTWVHLVVGAIYCFIITLVIIISIEVLDSNHPIMRTTEAVGNEGNMVSISALDVTELDNQKTLVGVLPKAGVDEEQKEEQKVEMNEEINEEKNEEMVEALKSMQANDYHKAVEQWLQIIEKDPGNSDAHAWLAACYGSIIDEVSLFKKMKYNNLMEASINEALILNPDSTLAHMVRGRRYLNAPNGFGGDVNKAIDDFKFCIENGRDDADIYYYLGQSYEKNGDNINAMKVYESALIKNPEHAQAKENLKNLQGT
jgi:Tfp pilus assembly protein PilF